MKAKNLRTTTGFTLLEILLVVGIISILAGIVIAAINPSRQLATVRNTERQSDLKQLYNAMNQYYIDYGRYPATSTLTTTLKEVCDTEDATSTHSVDCTNLLDLSILVPTYLVAIPKDPSATSTAGYKILKNSTNKLELTAPLAEIGTSVAIGTSTVVVELEWSATSPTGHTWDSANTYCTELGSGWRLPALSELLAALNNQFTDNGSNPGGFENNYIYWSGDEDGVDMAWLGYSQDGVVYSDNYAKEYSSPNARCVR